MSARNQLLASAGFVAVGLHRACGDRSRGRVGILVHHCVSPVVPGATARPYSVTPRVFRDQLAGLLKLGYQFVKLSDLLLARAAGEPLPPKRVILTFDDAYESVYREAFPVLRDLNVPAAVFLATAYLDSTEPFPFDAWSRAHAGSMAPQDFRPLTTGQCHEMADSGLIEFGAHTHTHQDFRGRPDDFRRDLEMSAAVIRRSFSLESVPFAFPYGRAHSGFCGGAMTEAARQAGVCCGLTTDCALVDPHSDDPFAWGRFNCYETDSATTIAAKLAGWFDWPHRAQVWLDRARGRKPAAIFKERTTEPESQPKLARKSEEHAALAVARSAD